MKSILMFHLDNCPYCHEARMWMDEVVKEHPEYGGIEIRMVEERKESDLAERYDYYYVPTYYVGGIKVHEGAATKKIVEQVYRKAYEE